MKRQGRRPRFTTPLTDARDFAVRALKRPLKLLPPTARFVVGLLAVASLTTLLLASTHSAQSAAEVYQEGDVVRSSVVSPADISSADARETERRREAARRETPPVWNFDAWQVENAAQSFRDSWAALKQQAGARAAGNSNQANGNGNSQRAEPLWPGTAANRQAVARAVSAHGFDA